MKIAVVGSGIAGLSSAWLLNRVEGFEVTLFEANDYYGGHSNTIDVQLEGKVFPVDTGFLVHNPNTYPHLIAFLKYLEVDVINTDMTFSVKLLKENIEWAGTNLKTVFCQKRNFFSFGFWKMIRDILKFNKNVDLYLEESRKNDLSLGELLKAKNFSNEFSLWYLIPMGAAIWSTSSEDMLKFPAASFIQFGKNHSLFQVEGRPRWRTIHKGSRVYVNKIISQLPRTYLNEPVLEVFRQDKVFVKTNKRTEEFDKIIFATHSDITMKLIKDPTSLEKEIVGAVEYSENIAYVHTDEKILPTNKTIWSAWNYLSDADSVSQKAVAVSYLINKLQPLPVETSVIVTLNPINPPEESKIIKKIIYHHPLFDKKAIAAQEKLPTIQGMNHTYFAGAWCKFGFHEDGIVSGVEVAKLLGAKVPW
jgi:predicted NAD/FAD-binding protein